MRDSKGITKWTSNKNPTFSDGRDHDTVFIQIQQKSSDSTVILALSYHENFEDCFNYNTTLSRSLSFSKKVAQDILPQDDKKEPIYIFDSPLKTNALINLFYGVRLENTWHIVKSLLSKDGTLPDTPVLHNGKTDNFGKSTYQNTVALFKRLLFQRHAGVDFHADRGTPIYAVADGEVFFNSGHIRGAGQVLILRHPLNYPKGPNPFVFSVYMHVLPPTAIDPRTKKLMAHPLAVVSKKSPHDLLRICSSDSCKVDKKDELTRPLKFGDHVNRGDFIAMSGAPPSTRNYHLHFEIRAPRITASSLANPKIAPNYDDFISNLQGLNQPMANFSPTLRNTLFSYAFTDSVTLNPADFIQVVDAKCQERKNWEMNSAAAFQNLHTFLVPTLTAGYCSQKYETKSEPGIYAIFKNSLEEGVSDYDGIGDFEDVNDFMSESNEPKDLILPSGPSESPALSPLVPSSMLWKPVLKLLSPPGLNPEDSSS